jgi:HK97 family phage major capsid protein
MFNHTSLQEQRNQLMQEAGDLVAGKSINKETRTKFDLMMNSVDLLNAKIELEQRSSIAGRPPRTQPGTDSTNPTEEQRTKDAFREWMRTGNVSAENRSYLKESRETRDLGATVGTGAQATAITASSVFIPVGFDPMIHSAAKSFGNLATNVRQLVTATGEPQKVATSDDTANGLTLISPELTPVVEQDMNLGGFVSYVSEFTTSLIKVSESLLEDSAFDVAGFISNSFATRYFRGLNQAIHQGSGNVGSIVAGVHVGATSAAPTAIALTDLLATFAALDPAYQDRAQFVMNSVTKANLMGLVDNFGRPLLQADVNGVPFNSIFGKTIIIDQFADNTAATKIPLLLADLEASYTLRTIQSGLKIVRLNERYAEFGEVGFIGRVRAGGYLTTQASSPSLVALQMHA